MRKLDDGSILVEVGDDLKQMFKDAKDGDRFTLQKGVHLIKYPVEVTHKTEEIDLKTSIMLGDESIISIAATKMRLAVLQEACEAICKKCKNDEPITFIRDQGYYHDRYYCPASDIHILIDTKSINIRLETLKDAAKMICEECKNDIMIDAISGSAYYHHGSLCPASAIHSVIYREFIKHG